LQKRILCKTIDILEKNDKMNNVESKKTLSKQNNY